MITPMVLSKNSFARVGTYAIRRFEKSFASVGYCWYLCLLFGGFKRQRMITIGNERFLKKITKTDEYLLIEGDLEDMELVVENCRIDNETRK